MSRPRDVDGRRRCPRCAEWKPLDQFSTLGKYCRVCANAKAQERKRSTVLAADDPRHGTANGYTNLGCRCVRCKAAKMEQRRADSARHARPPANPVTCSLCSREFSARGIGFHRTTCTGPKPPKIRAERRVVERLPRVQAAPRAKQSRPAPEPEPTRYGPDPSSWARPKPGMVVLEVVEELSEDELQRLLGRGANVG